MRFSTGTVPVACDVKASQVGQETVNGVRYFGVGNSRTSKSESTVGHSGGFDSTHDSAATAMGEPLEMAEGIWGNSTTPDATICPPEAARLPTTPAGSTTAMTSGVRTLVSSPDGLSVEHPADWDCQDGMANNGHTTSTPAFEPVVAQVAKTPSVPGAGGPVVGGFGELDG